MIAHRVGGYDALLVQVKKLCIEKGIGDAVRFTVSLSRNKVLISKDILFLLLQECTRKRDKANGQQVHWLMINNGLQSCNVLQERTIHMLASCGNFEQAKQEFHELSRPSIFAWNAIISAHVALGECDKAFDRFLQMQQKGVEPDKLTFLCLLKTCTRTLSLALGRHVHEQILRSGYDSDRFVCNSLINMYSKCKSLEEAHRIFELLPSQDVVSWGAIITGYAQDGHGSRALELFEKMCKKGVEPNLVIFLSILKACASLGDGLRGSKIHDEVIRSGIEDDILMEGTLIDMYAKSGGLEEARRLFDMLQRATVVSWGALIAGYVQNGDSAVALELFRKLEHEGIHPDTFIFSCTVKACTSLKSLQLGTHVHCQIVSCGFRLDAVVGNGLIDMYSKCGCLEQARHVFEEMTERDVVSWGAIIVGYVQQDHTHPALELYARMQEGGVKPDKVTFSCILKACGGIGSLSDGRLIHDQIVKTDLVSDGIIGNALVDMYAKCGSLHEARRMFDSQPKHDVVSWSAIIAAYTQSGKCHFALQLFEKMQNERIEPDGMAFLSSLKACSDINALHYGRLLHDQILKRGLKSDIIIGNALLDMYSKCGSLEEAQRVFDGLPKRAIASWGVMIGGYATHGYKTLALELFLNMQQEGIVPDKITFLCTLKACATSMALKQGRLIHDQIMTTEHQADLVIVNALIDMYGKCGSLEDAHNVFDRLLTRNVVSWDALITGYTQHKKGHIALMLWEKMKEEGVRPIKVTFVCILKACSSTGAIDQGRLLHADIIKCGRDADANITNTLVDTYAKCGSLEDGVYVFDKLVSPDLLSWSALVGGYARYGDYVRAIKCLECMQRQGVKPNAEIYMGVLNACRQAGAAEEGGRCFKSMIEDGLVPCLEHYSCMVDLLGNAGCFDEALKLIKEMPREPDAILWTSLLTCSRFFGNLDVGRLCLDQLSHLDPGDASTYVLMSNMFADANMWDEAERISELRRSAGAQKKPGLAWVEVNNKVHEFSVGSFQSDEVHAALNKLSGPLRWYGHVPQVDSLLEPISSGQEQDCLWGVHHEKLNFGFEHYVREESFRMCSACVF